MINIQSFINKQALLDIRLGYRPKTINFKAITSTLKETPEEDFNMGKVKFFSKEILSKKTKDEVLSSNTEGSGRFKHADAQAKVMLEMFSACRRHWIEALNTLDIDIINSGVLIDTVYEKQVDREPMTNPIYPLELINDLLISPCNEASKYKRILFTTGITGYKKVYNEDGTSVLYMIFENAAKFQVLKITIQ